MSSTFDSPADKLATLERNSIASVKFTCGKENVLSDMDSYYCTTKIEWESSKEDGNFEESMDVCKSNKGRELHDADLIELTICSINVSFFFIRWRKSYGILADWLFYTRLLPRFQMIPHNLSCTLRPSMLY